MEEYILKRQKQNTIIISIIFIIFGALIALASIFAFDGLVNVLLICFGIVIILMNIIPLTVACYKVSYDKRYLFDLITSILAIILGGLFIFEHGIAVTIISSVYLIILPIIRIILAKDKVERLKKELPLFFIAILIFFNILQWLLQILLIVVGALFVIYGLFILIKCLINKNDKDDNNDNFPNNDRIVIDADVNEL